jgi:ubiquinone/menaquinone biosynthesis C-methylase UbiE
VTRAYRELYRHHGQTSPPAFAQPVMAKIRGESVADVGCGAGVYGYLLRTSWHFTGSWTEENIPAARNLVGIDFSQMAIDVIQRHSVYHRALLADSNRLTLANNEVDRAVSMENLEHLFPSEAIGALHELARIAKRRVVITTPGAMDGGQSLLARPRDTRSRDRR